VKNCGFKTNKPFIVPEGSSSLNEHCFQGRHRNNCIFGNACTGDKQFEYFFSLKRQDTLCPGCVIEVVKRLKKTRRRIKLSDGKGFYWANMMMRRWLS
jgi:hypothetical protein